MKRKVIKQGHNTFTVTLPVKWARQQGIAPSSEIDVLEQGNSLMLTAGNNESKSKRVEINITGLPNPLLWRFISAAYRAGYDEIKIYFDGIDNAKKKFKKLSYNMNDWFYRGRLPKDRNLQLPTIEVIQMLIDRFIGVEIIEQKPNYVIVKQLGEISYREFDNALRRILMIIVSMGKEILEAIKNKDDSALCAMHMIDTNLDRFEDYCLRVLNVKGYEDYKKTAIIYSTIFLLEMVGDEYKRIAKHIISDKPKYNKSLLNFFNEINEQFESYFGLFYDFSQEKAIKVFAKEDEFYKIAKKIYPPASNDEKELLHHLKKITGFIISLTELAIDLKADSIQKNQ